MPVFDAQQIDVLPPDAKTPEVERSSDNSLREALEGAFDQPDSGSPSGTPASPKDGATVPPGGAPESAPGGRPRGPDGKFAAKEAPPALDIPKFGEKPPAAPEGEKAPDDPIAKAPASWKPEKAALWEKIADPEARAYVHEREKQLQEGFQRAAQVREVAEGILSEFVPYQEILAQENATPATAIRALLQTAFALRTAEPEYRKALFLQLAQQYGVDFSQGVNPQIAAAQAEAANLKHQRMVEQAQSGYGQEREVSAAIEQFAATHEFFPKVRAVMGKLIDAGLAPDLETAYQQAAAYVPEVAAEMERRRVAAAQDAQREADRQRAASATRGGSAPGAGSFPGGGAPKPANSIREALEAAWAERERS